MYLSAFISPLRIGQSLVKQVNHRTLEILQLRESESKDLVIPSDQCNLAMENFSCPAILQGGYTSVDLCSSTSQCAQEQCDHLSKHRHGAFPTWWRIPSEALLPNCAGWHSPEYILIGTGLILQNQILDQQQGSKGLLQAQPCSKTPTSAPHPSTWRNSLSGQERPSLLKVAVWTFSPSAEGREERGLPRELRNRNRKKRCLKDRNFWGEVGPLKHLCPGSPTHWNEISGTSIFPSVK